MIIDPTGVAVATAPGVMRLRRGRREPGQPFGATEALRVTPSSGSRLPGGCQESHGSRVTPTIRLFGETRKVPLGL
jgi:hypothetical protein